MLMLSQVLGGDTASRAWMRLREKEGLSYGVGTYVQVDPFDAVGAFGGYAIVAPQNLAKAKASLLEEINRIIGAKVTDDELRRAKDGWIKDQDTSLSQDGTVVQMLANQTFRKRTTAFTKELRARIQAVTPADIERVAKKYLEPKRMVVIDAGDQAKSKPKN
jgi:zinc protease